MPIILQVYLIQKHFRDSGYLSIIGATFFAERFFLFFLRCHGLLLIPIPVHFISANSLLRLFDMITSKIEVPLKGLLERLVMANLEKEYRKKRYTRIMHPWGIFSGVL